MKNYSRSVGKSPLYPRAAQKFVSLFYDSRGHLVDYRLNALREVFIYLEFHFGGEPVDSSAKSFDSLFNEYLFKQDFISCVRRYFFDEFGVSSLELFTDGHTTIFFKPVGIYPSNNN